MARNESDESVLLDTAALRTTITGADVSDEFRTAFVTGLTEAGVFAGDTIPASQLGQAISRILAEGRVTISVDFGTMMGVIAILKRPSEIYKEPVLVSVAQLKVVMDEASVSTEFFLDFLAGLTEAGVFASDTIDSIALGMAIGRLVTDGKVTDGADFAVMTAAISSLDPAPEIH
ncbi:MAG: hypothetical protein ACEQSB_03845 [Undibacterium sp.]